MPCRGEAIQRDLDKCSRKSGDKGAMKSRKGHPFPTVREAIRCFNRGAANAPAMVVSAYILPTTSRVVFAMCCENT